MFEAIRRLLAKLATPSSKSAGTNPGRPATPISPSWETAPWMRWMEQHLGEVERTGQPTTAFIESIFTHTNYGRLGGITQPACAATACAALEETGYKSPHNAAAISFKNYGTPCDLKPGCICVFEWEPGEHHVSFCYAPGAFISSFLGGNQSHLLQISKYENKYLIATRWPVKNDA